MITFRNIIHVLSNIAFQNYQLHSFHSGLLDEVDIGKLETGSYPILYAEPGNAIINTGVMTYSFTLYILDQINDAETELNANSSSDVKERVGRVDILSENLQILNDVISQFKQNLSSRSYVNDEIVLNLPITAEPFTARFNNLLTGWSASIELQVNNGNNICIAPFNNPS